MKKIFTFLVASLCALSASAITVTFNGNNIENGSTVTVGADAFSLVNKVPGVIYSMEAESTIYVSGASGMSLNATSDTDKITICELSGQCYTLTGSSAPYSMSISSFSDGFNVDLSYSQVTEVPSERNAVDITINSSDGEFKFTFVYDCTSAGVKNLISDDNGLYTVYSLLGNMVLKTTHKSEIYNLPKGIYIVNGKKIYIR